MFDRARHHQFLTHQRLTQVMTMDNDILIDQARQLYAALHARQTKLFALNNSKLDRLEHLVSCAYGRYQRRLNRCALCYQTRKHDCVREPGKKRIPCQRRNPFVPIAGF